MASEAENRKYARIESSIACSVATATRAFEAVVANLSRGGLALIGPEGVEVGEALTVILERFEGQVTVSLPGTVVRTEERDERRVYGVQFAPLAPEDDAQLLKLLRLLAAGRGQGRRTTPRVAVRVEVACRTESTFRTRLNDLSRGGLSFRSVKHLAPGTTITISFGVQGLKGLVEVSGEVVSCQPLEPGRFRVGVRFDSLSRAEQAQVNATLDVLMGITLPSGELVEEDE